MGHFSGTGQGGVSTRYLGTTPDRAPRSSGNMAGGSTMTSTTREMDKQGINLSLLNMNFILYHGCGILSEQQSNHRKTISVLTSIDSFFLYIPYALYD